MKIHIEPEPGNQALKSGAMPKSLQNTIQRVKPEAAYFFPEEGLRTAYVFFDLREPSDIPSIVEPLFQELDAKVDIMPVMNADELQSGLRKVA